MNNLDRKIEEFIEGISYLWKTEALSGDETEDISKRILTKLDEVNGNA